MRRIKEWSITNLKTVYIVVVSGIKANEKFKKATKKELPSIPEIKEEVYVLPKASIFKLEARQNKRVMEKKYEGLLNEKVITEMPYIAVLELKVPAKERDFLQKAINIHKTIASLKDIVSI